jgi:hypothetical protein
LPIPSEKFARGLPITSDTLKQIYQRVANTLLPPVTNLTEGCQQPMAHLQEGCPNCTQRGNLFAIPLKKVKFKVKNQKARNSYTTFRGSSLNEALSIHTTNNTSKSRETVPLRPGNYKSSIF